MGQKTGIEWTESTWNPIRGCSRLSEGCRNCYAETVANRFKSPGEPYEGLIAKSGQWNGNIAVANHKMFDPLRWTRPRMIFVNSMSDLFHPNVPDSIIDQVFAVMALSPRHTFQILTKRADRMLAYLSDPSLVERIDLAEYAIYTSGNSFRTNFTFNMGSRNHPMPLGNVWLGVSVEDQTTAEERIALLLETPAAVRWISAEPLLGPVDLSSLPYPSKVSGNLHWVVVGGESGTHARPMHPDWARNLRNQCQSAGVPFLFKQWGEWLPVLGQSEGVPIRGRKHSFDDGTFVGWVGKKHAGRCLDGRIWDEYPEATQ